MTQGLALRARTILLADEGMTNGQVAEALGITPVTVGKSRARFLRSGVDGLLDEPRPGALRSIADEEVERVVTWTLEEMPTTQPTGAPAPWLGRLGSARALSVVSGVHSPSNPTAARPFRLSSDPLFIEKVRDIVDLSVNPPDRILVLCVDEKSQMHAGMRWF